MSKSLIVFSLLVLMIIIKDCHGALFFQHRFNPKMVERPAKVAVLDHPKPEKLTLSQILRFWAQSAGLENQKVILKNPVPLCIQQEWGRKFPFNQKKCGYMKAFVCSKTCKIKMVK